MRTTSSPTRDIILAHATSTCSSPPCANIIRARAWVGGVWGDLCLDLVRICRPLSTGAVMEGESTSLRAEFQVFLDNPANFDNVVMEGSGEHAQRGGL